MSDNQNNSTPLEDLNAAKDAELKICDPNHRSTIEQRYNTCVDIYSEFPVMAEGQRSPPLVELLERLLTRWMISGVEHMDFSNDNIKQASHEALTALKDNNTDDIRTAIARCIVLQGRIAHLMQQDALHTQVDTQKNPGNPSNPEGGPSLK